MKTLYLIGGPMGVGKTTVSQKLKRLLPNSVFLDGDWCWDMEPFRVNGETKAMVLENICFLLNNFLKCSVLDHVIFCWVMHEQEIMDTLLSRLELLECRCVKVSLVCSEEELRARLEKDIEAGRREAALMERSVERLPMYRELNTIKIDTTGMTPEETARLISGL